eukprot:TRINITY_DN17743_c0_g1_i1.p1 TRINITY_DN17743_c0_g1~~TRINITY_DN17743_c0_g1_i1.p1  ORF type:complete len:258 (-),score=72.77 TRINITY_DN17743_c0_g1_i1:252-1025(-)
MAQATCRRLQGRTAIVTASTAGIGLAIARRLASEGANVVISSRKQENVSSAVEELVKEGLKVVGVVCHVAKAEDRNKLIQTAVDNFGTIDIFVSNAAVNPSVANILEMKEAEIAKILDVNVRAPIQLIQEAAPHMTKSGRGSVVFVSSIAAFRPEAPIAVYGISKTALLGLTKGLAQEMAPTVRVNCVAPGFVQTRFAEFLLKDEESAAAVEATTLLGRLGRVEDMAAVVAFLASDDAAYITGETIVVAGGMVPARL